MATKDFATSSTEQVADGMYKQAKENVVNLKTKVDSLKSSLSEAFDAASKPVQECFLKPLSHMLNNVDADLPKLKYAISDIGQDIGDTFNEMRLRLEWKQSTVDVISHFVDEWLPDLTAVQESAQDKGAELAERMSKDPVFSAFREKMYESTVFAHQMGSDALAEMGLGLTAMEEWWAKTRRPGGGEEL